ncbi:MAG: M13 family metallopeptidase [Acidobacteriota bacterium]
MRNGASLTAAILFCLAGCAGNNPPAAAPEATMPATSAPPVEMPAATNALGFDRSYLDPTAFACQDFYQYSTGGWLAKNPIPAAFTSWGTSSNLAEENRETLRTVMESAAAKPASLRTPNEQKIGDFWTSCMDEQQIESAGIKPLQPELDRIAAMRSVGDLENEFARFQQMQIRVPFRLDSSQDLKNSAEVIAEVGQSGLGLPDRDYYTKSDEASQKIRDQYLEHVTRMFVLMGDDPSTAASEAQAVMGIETSLAKASMTRVQRRDPNAVYHRMSVGQLGAVTPHFNWPDYFAAVGARSVTAVNAAQPDFLREVDRQITATPISDWKTYLRGHLIRAAASSLSDKFADEAFRFRGTVLQGQKEQQPRWKRCVAAADNQLGEALGQAWVEKKFSPEAKRRSVEMVQNMIAALGDELPELPWMSEATRRQALVKLRAFQPKIGYPDQWRDYSALTITPGPYVNNIRAADSFEFRRDMAKIGKPVDRGEWGMTPPTFNAYYNPSLNEIVFPAGILQWPMFDVNQDDAFNYGAIGSVIGHEMSHGFDDEGSQFDASGNLSNWWTPEDLKNFQARAACIEHQFDQYEIEPGIHHNGKLVAGESIADLGGAVIAWNAWQKSMAGKPLPPVVDGFTPEQRFFLGFSRARARNVTPESMRLRINTDPHPASKFRVNGPLSNMPQFAAAFGCKSGEAMVRPAEKRCEIW